MAGIGRPPKPAALRQRRNRKSGAAVLPSAPRAGRIPELPERACPCGGAEVAPAKRKRGRPRKVVPGVCRVCLGTGIQVWHAQTSEWWRAIWRSPMSSQWLEADRQGLYRVAMLVDAFWHGGGDVRLASEIRLQQQAYGLTPLDRERLQWSFEHPDKTARVAPDEPEAVSDEERARMGNVLAFAGGSG
jgi:hypothetical protein